MASSDGVSAQRRGRERRRRPVDPASRRGRLRSRQQCPMRQLGQPTHRRRLSAREVDRSGAGQRHQRLPLLKLLAPQCRGRSRVCDGSESAVLARRSGTGRPEPSALLGGVASGHSAGPQQPMGSACVRAARALRPPPKARRGRQVALGSAGHGQSREAAGRVSARSGRPRGASRRADIAGRQPMQLGSRCQPNAEGVKKRERRVQDHRCSVGKSTVRNNRRDYGQRCLQRKRGHRQTPNHADGQQQRSPPHSSAQRRCLRHIRASPERSGHGAEDLRRREWHLGRGGGRLGGHREQPRARRVRSRHLHNQSPVWIDLPQPLLQVQGRHRGR